MSAAAKARAWALAGALPVIAVASFVSDRTAGALLIVAALGWAWLTAILAEHAWQQPTVKWLERRNLDLETQLAATEAALKAMARRRSDHASGVVVDLRPASDSHELARRIRESRADARTDPHAEPTEAEIALAKADIVAAFEPWEVER